MKRYFSFKRSYTVDSEDLAEFIIQFKRNLRDKIAGYFPKTFVVGESLITFSGNPLQFWFVSLIEVINKGEIKIEKGSKILNVSYNLDFYHRFLILFFLFLPFAAIIFIYDLIPFYFTFLYPLPYLAFFYLASSFAYFRFDSLFTQCIKDAGGDII